MICCHVNSNPKERINAGAITNSAVGPAINLSSVSVVHPFPPPIQI